MDNEIRDREEMLVDPETTRSIDRKRWFTLFLQIIVGSITAYIYIINIYIGPMAEQRGWNPQTVVLAFSLMTAVGIVASIVGGSLRDRFGNRWCLKVGGLGFGICVLISSLKASVWLFVLGQGVGATFFMYVVYVSQMANIAALFPDRKGMALGIGIGGINLGSALIAPLAEWLLRTMGISPSIALQGIVYGGVTVLCGFLITEAPKGYKPMGWTLDEIEREDGEIVKENEIDGFTWKETIKTSGFWLMSLCFAISSVLIMGVSSNMSLLAQDCLGVGTAKAAWIYTVFCVFGGFGGFVVGSISDRLGSLRTWLYCSFITFLAVIAFALFGLNVFSFFMIVVCGLVGLVMGAMQTLLVASLMDAFGGKNFGINFGLIQVLGAAATMIGSELSVTLPSRSFFIIGALCSAAAVLIGLITIKAVNRARQMKVL